MFESLFDISSTTITISETVYMLVFALVSGLIISITYMKTYENNNYSQNFALTMVLLPLVISLIIMLIGSDIARAFSLAGAFSIIRFRSAPGEPKDIGFVLFSLSAGLAAGVGAQAYTVAFTVILCLVMYVLSKLKFGDHKVSKQLLKIMIPEDLSYQEEFPQIFESYDIVHKLLKVKTTSLGSLYQLYYEVQMREDTNVQELLNEIRTRNSNLNISINMIENTDY